MKKQIFIILVLTSGIGIALVLGVRKSQFTAEVVDSTKLETPEIALEKYWNAAFLGDKKSVNSMSLLVDDWWDGCQVVEIIESNSKISVSEDKQSSREIINKMTNFEFEKENVNKQISNENLFPDTDGVFDGENISDGIKHLSRYIWASKVDRKRFKIVSDRSYNNETLLNVELADFDGNFSKATKYGFGFKKIENNWKLVGAIQTRSFDFVDEQSRYGTSQSLCK